MYIVHHIYTYMCAHTTSDVMMVEQYCLHYISGYLRWLNKYAIYVEPT